MQDNLSTCQWCVNDRLYQQYHDQEWGVPVYEDSRLFELLVLEGAQAGLSWITVLRKRERYRQVFDQFDPEKIARYNQQKVAELLKDRGIIRNRLKIQSAINNATAYLKIIERGETFSNYIWQFVDGRVIQNRVQTEADIATESTESVAMSKQLKKDGFSFVGPTICYAFMQAAGMVNDHLIDCFRYRQLC